MDSIRTLKSIGGIGKKQMPDILKEKGVPGINIIGMMQKKNLKSIK